MRWILTVLLHFLLDQGELSPFKMTSLLSYKKISHSHLENDSFKEIYIFI
jgi:hypothetical protein